MPAVSSDPRQRQLTIKTGVVRRLAKERTVCEKELQTERNRFEKLKKDGADDHVLKKQEEVIQECLMMIPDSQRRFQKEYEALNKFLEDEVELKETKEYQTAEQLLFEVKGALA